MFSTMPSTGTFIMRAMFAAFSTIMPTSSWGEVTISMPSSGSDWNTVRGTSPVPGGMSTNMKSTSSHITSVQNCFTVPAITGPRQMTGSVSLSSSRFRDTILMPVVLAAGRMPSSEASSWPFTPKALGMDGPVTSASSMATLWPRLRSSTLIRLVTRDLPTPPLPLTTPMTFFTWLWAFAGAEKSGAPPLRLGQFSPQLLQSWVQFSLMGKHLQF